MTVTLRNISRALAGAALLALAACATPEGPRTGFAETDDFEPTSRNVHDVNLALDEYVLRPVAQGYDVVTPTLVQHLVGNGFSHLALPRDFLNQLMQGDVDAGLTTLGRFVVNTLLGAGGLLDPATEFGLPRQATDFGVTLGKLGVDEGSYVVLPLMGPSTVRDSFALIVDAAMSPLTYLGMATGIDGLGVAVGVGDRVDQRNRNAALIDDALYESADSYVTIRAGYLQRRRAQIAEGSPDAAVDSLPDIFDEEEAPAAD